MTSLAQLSGLPIELDEERQYFVLGEELNCSKCKEVPLKELLPTLLNKSLCYPEYVYTCHKNLVYKEHLSSGKWPHQMRYDVYLLPYGLLGIEYIKTHIYFTPYVEGQIAAIVEVLHGELTIVLQKNQPKGEFDFDTHVEDAVIVRVKTGNKAVIPTGYMYTFVNPTTGAVVFSILKTDDQIIDYTAISREQGLAYFFIAKNARAELVTNPRYRTTPQATWRQLKSALELVDLEASLNELDDPLYQIAVEYTQDLTELLYS